MKKILIIIAVLLVAGGAWYLMNGKTGLPGEQGAQMGSDVNNRPGAELPEGASGSGKLKAANFSGKLEKVDNGCFADGECYVVIDSKHVTTLTGMRLGGPGVVGQVIGVPTLGDLESKLGGNFEVYAMDKGDGTYTLYGSEGFYVKYTGK